MRRFSLVFTGVMLLLPHTGRLEAGWSFRGLGTLGGQTSRAFAVSASGSFVVGGSENTEGIGEAFRWEDGLMVGLFTPASGWQLDYGFGVSDDGSLVVGSGIGRALLWQNGTIVDLNPRVPPPAQALSAAYDVSADGSVVVGWTAIFRFGSQPRSLAAGWERVDEEWVRTFSARPLGGDWSVGNGVSADGSVMVGTAENAAGNREAYRWEDGSTLRLGTLGGQESWGYDVSADGSVIVGKSDNVDGMIEAFRWEAGVMLGLGAVEGGSSYAQGVSGDGSIVVGTLLDGQGDPEAFVWSDPDGMRSLAELLINAGVDLEGWQLLEATGVSGDGKVIVGTGYNPEGHQRAWIATIPEPSTLLLLSTLAAALGLFHAVRRRKRKT